MLFPIGVIQHDERSAAVGNLHKAIEAFGFEINSEERNSQRAGKSTTAMVKRFQKEFEIDADPDVLIDTKTADVMNRMMREKGLGLNPVNASFMVEGHITDPRGRPVPGLAVTAYDRDMRSRETLGSTRTAADGRYMIHYAVDTFSRAEARRADLEIEIADPQGQVIHTTPTQFNAQRRAKIDITLESLGDESLYDRVHRVVAPVAEGQKVALSEIEEDDTHADITFLSAETGFAANTLVAFTAGHRLYARTDLDARFWFAAVESGATSLPSVPESGPEPMDPVADKLRLRVLATPLDTLREGMERALSSGVLAPELEKDAKGWLEHVARLQAKGDAAPPRGPAVVADALKLKGKAREVFLTATVQRDGRKAVIETLRKSGAFDDAGIARVSRGLELSELTFGDPDLVAHFNAKLGADAPARRIARLATAEYIEAIKAAKAKPPSYVKGSTAAQKRKNYANLLSRRAARVYPTAAFTGGLERALQADASAIAIPEAPEIARFLDRAETFELATTSVRGFEKEFGDTDGARVLIEPLEATQRVFKLSPDFATTNAILAAGYTSAADIVARGKTRFVTTFEGREGFDLRIAQNVYERAANTHAAVVTLAGEMFEPATVEFNGSLVSNPGQMVGFPNLETLFGGGDFCACTHCRSIFSPAAYLAEILRFLDARDAVAPAVSAKDILFRRRPDIGFIELSCENSNTPLPYIDLVNEALEHAIAPGPDFVLPAEVQGELAAGPVSAALRAAIAAADPAAEPDQDARLSERDSTNAFVLRDGDRATWRIVDDGGPIEVFLLRQTRRKADELRAAPEYVHQPAYTTLRTARYPWVLPFDLSTTEVREFLDNANTPRAEIMEAFRGSNPPNNPSFLDISAERIGLDPFERPIYLQPEVAQQHQFWGEASNAAAITAMSNVKAFLDPTGLEYEDLLRLLSMEFINPGSALTITHLDDSCDTAQKTIAGLDAPALDRIHRFLRLWRRTGLQMWELDLLIAHPAFGAGALGETLVAQMGVLDWLRKRFPKLSLERLAAFFAPLSTVSKYSEAYEPRDPSLYETLFLDRRRINPADPAFEIAAVTAANPPETLENHLPPILAALRLREDDLALLRADLPDDVLNLANLSHVFRHATLAKSMGRKAKDWQKLLEITQENPFANPAALRAFVERVDRLDDGPLKIDEVRWLLAADPEAKGALADAAAGQILGGLRQSLQDIAAANDPTELPADLAGLRDQLAANLVALGYTPEEAVELDKLLSGTTRLTQVAAGLPAGFDFPAPITAVIPVSLDEPTGRISFTGFMTDAQRTNLLNDPQLGAVTGIVAYQDAINALHETPRLMLAYVRPEFRTPLSPLPAEIRFSEQLPPDVLPRIAYDTERGDVVFRGIMTEATRDTVTALSADADWQAAVAQLFAAPRNAPPPVQEAWLTPADLAFPLADNLTANLAVALSRQTVFMAETLSQHAVHDAVTQAFGQSVATSELLLTRLERFLPARPLRDVFTAPAFARSSAALDPAGFPEPFQSLRLVHRIAMLLAKTKTGYATLNWLIDRAADIGALDFIDLPLDYAPPVLVPFADYLDLVDFLALDSRVSTPDLSLRDVMDGLIDATLSQADFAAELSFLTGWPEPLIDALSQANTLDIAFPGDFHTTPALGRLAEAVRLAARLGADAATMLALAGPGVDMGAADALKQALRARHGDENWLDVSTGVQDILRERKRDALLAYLLTRPMPADAPSGTWRKPTDVFAHLLIDPEMSSCQLSSRIVQAHNAIQMFVQRAFLGLEPDIRVSIEQDDGWTQWSFMRMYRVWEAAMKVFTFPEVFIEPELNRHVSPAYKAFLDELAQNEVNKDTVETAYINYLDRLDDISQLEITGLWHEDAKRILHVIGRSPGGEPYTYYYRTFVDERRWTSWVKIDNEIQSDTVLPFVSEERLHLVWPEYRDEQVPVGSIAVPNQGDNSFDTDEPLKRMNIHLAVTQFRNGKWTPRKVSRAAVRSNVYLGDFDDSAVMIVPLDFTWLPDGEFYIWLHSGDASGLFEIAGCRGYPVPAINPPPLYPILTRFQRDGLIDMRNREVEQGSPLVPHGNIVLNEQILRQTPGMFDITYPHHMSYIDKLFAVMFQLAWAAQTSGSSVTTAKLRYLPLQLGTFYTWFYADRNRTFFVQPKLMSDETGESLYYSDFVDFVTDVIDFILAGQASAFYDAVGEFGAKAYEFKLNFSTHYHPLVCRFAKEVNKRGVEGLMDRRTQFADKGLDFVGTYAPMPIVEPDYPHERVDFSPGGAYAGYNWETFFHLPLTLATRLSQEQRFEDAMRWFHFIFDPTGGADRHPLTNAQVGVPQKFWVTKPFFERQTPEYRQERIEAIMGMLAADPATVPDPALQQELERQVMDWRRNPFDPHLIAAFRSTAYQKATVLKYLDNLIAMGDSRFRMGTMESVMEALQIYVLAQELLGPRPRVVPPAARPVPQTFNELEPSFGALSNAYVGMENLVPPMAPMPAPDNAPALPNIPNLLYFCIPQNDRLLAYWDRVEDRLFKIRNCLDIDGVARQLSLFAPPIDPAMLVRAAAAGLDLSTVLGDLNAPLPHYRFQVHLDRARAFAQDVTSLGNALLSALDKKDIKALEKLRQGHEIRVLEAARDIRLKSIDEAKEALEATKWSKLLAEVRKDYYEGKDFMNAGEIVAMTLSSGALVSYALATAAEVLAGAMFLIPDFQIGASGFGGSPHVSAKTGGKSIGKSAERGANGLYNIGTILSQSAEIARTVAVYQRREEDWDHEAEKAKKEISRAAREIAAAEIRLAIAEKELENHDKQIEDATEVADFLEDQYTNEELYTWMSGAVSKIYFASYTLALDMAKRAERCHRFELGLASSNHIKPGHWDSLHKGLLSGERLLGDLRKLEAAHLDQNRREFECVKHISLARTNPAALLALKDGGACTFNVPEMLFDADFPGHYFRRIKSVSLSIPGMVGPQTTLAATLRLLNNEIRISPDMGAQYARNVEDGIPVEDPRFRENNIRVKAVATSTAQEDTGLFQLNFDGDPRYLPFEGAGAVSTWAIELMQTRALRQFDYDSITDAVLTIRYTSREDAGPFRDAAAQNLLDIYFGAADEAALNRLFDMTREFPSEWYAFTTPDPGATPSLGFSVRPLHFPTVAQLSTIRIGAVTVHARADIDLEVEVTIPGAAAELVVLSATTDPNGAFASATTGLLDLDIDPNQPWEIRVRGAGGTFAAFDATQIEEFYLDVAYTLV